MISISDANTFVMSSIQYRKTRFVCVSDTHNTSPETGAFKLPKGDVLIHAGDLTKQGTQAELRKALDWIEMADFEEKIVIAGRHDECQHFISSSI